MAVPRISGCAVQIDSTLIASVPLPYQPTAAPIGLLDVSVAVLCQFRNCVAFKPCQIANAPKLHDSATLTAGSSLCC